MGALPLPLSWGKENNEEGVWNLFSNSVMIIWCRDYSGILHRRDLSAGWCLSWVKSRLQTSQCQDLCAFSQCHCLQLGSGMGAPTQSQRPPQGWLQSFPGRLQADRSSVHAQVGLALSADSEGCSKAHKYNTERAELQLVSSHSISSQVVSIKAIHQQSQRLNCGISALLSHSSAGKSDSLWRYTRADFSAAAFLPDSSEAHHTGQLLFPQGTGCRRT